MDPQPPPGARVVGRGRISFVPVWALILLIGVSGFIYGELWSLLVLGVPFTLLGVFGLIMLARSRVWVDGPVLYSRRTLRYAPPVRLDQLLRADLNENHNFSRELWLHAPGGNSLRLDATNLRLVRLYGAMAPYVPSGVANERLQRRLDRYGDPVGLPR